MAFRVLTSVTTEEATQPAFSNLTVFQDQRIYDFPLDGSRQATIFDASREYFTLLDGQLRMQCQVTGQELLQLVAAIGQRDRRAGAGQGPLSAKSAYRESFDPDSLRLELSAADGTVTYVAVGQQPEQPWAVEAYGRFANWFARLNATRDGRSPEARLQLNQGLCGRQLVPLSILRRVPQQQTYISQHDFQWSLPSQDLDRIRVAREWSEGFRHVTLVQFRRRQAEASPPEARR